MLSTLKNVWSSDEGQDIVEYMFMLAVILVIVAGVIHMIGTAALKAFSETASAVGS